MAPQPGGSTFVDAAAVPVADGRADDHTAKIRQTGGAAGIYGMTLCKTENFSGSFGTFRICVFRQYTAVPVRLKAGLDVWRTNLPLKIPHEKAAL